MVAAGEGGFARYGVREEVGTDGGFMETYGLSLGGGNVGRETLTFAPNSQAVSLVVRRPLSVCHIPHRGLTGEREGHSMNRVSSACVADIVFARAPARARAPCTHTPRQ